MRVPVQLERAEEVAQRRGVHVRRRRAVRRHQPVGVDRLQLDGAGAGGRGRIHHAPARGRASRRGSGRSRRSRTPAPRADAAAGNLKPHGHRFPSPDVRRAAGTSSSIDDRVGVAVSAAPHAAVRDADGAQPGRARAPWMSRARSSPTNTACDAGTPQRGEHGVERGARRLAARRVLLGVEHRVHARVEAERLDLARAASRAGRWSGCPGASRRRAAARAPRPPPTRAPASARAGG